MYDVVTIGSVAQDTYVVSSAFRVYKNKSRGPMLSIPWGTKTLLDTFHMEVGGGATNAAATFRRLGMKTAVIGRCGDDPSGAFVRRELESLGIDTQHIVVEKGGRTAYSVIFLAKNGERTILVYRGVAEDYDPIVPQVRSVETRWLYLSSLGGDVHALRSIMQKKEEGVNIAWNPGKAELKFSGRELLGLLRRVDAVFVNTEESRMLSKRIGRKQVPVPLYVATDGEFGSVAHIGSKVYRAKIRKVKASDTTGAGDAFGSAFVAALMRRPGDFSYALYVASANAMSVVQKVGAKKGILSLQQLSAYKKRITIIS